jgi:hypothetical protein
MARTHEAFVALVTLGLQTTSEPQPQPQALVEMFSVLSELNHEDTSSVLIEAIGSVCGLLEYLHFLTGHAPETVMQNFAVGVLRKLNEGAYEE